MVLDLCKILCSFLLLSFLYACGKVSVPQKLESDTQLATPVCNSSFRKDYLDIRISATQLQRGIQLGEKENKLYQRVQHLNESCIRFIQNHPYDEECIEVGSENAPRLRFISELQPQCNYARYLLLRWNPPKSSN